MSTSAFLGSAQEPLMSSDESSGINTCDKYLRPSGEERLAERERAVARRERALAEREKELALREENPLSRGESLMDRRSA